ncbi:MAG: hypothetical protein WC306_03190 [Candidatus Paceibacterota bacterium]
MVHKTRINFSEPIVKFIIAIIILDIIFVGVIQLIRQRGEQVRREQAIAQVGAKEDHKESESTNKATNDQTDDDTTSSQNDFAIVQEDLPETGVSELFISILAIGCLAASAASYLLSVKSCRSLFDLQVYMRYNKE